MRVEANVAGTASTTVQSGHRHSASYCLTSASTSSKGDAPVTGNPGLAVRSVLAGFGPVAAAGRHSPSPSSLVLPDSRGSLVDGIGAFAWPRRCCLFGPSSPELIRAVGFSSAATDCSDAKRWALRSCALRATGFSESAAGQAAAKRHGLRTGLWCSSSLTAAGPWHGAGSG